MRRFLFGVFAASFLAGMLTGCQTTHPIADSGGCSTSCSAPCATGNCGSSCGNGGCKSCGPIRGLGLICHTAGVCDCDNDEDPCAHRAPWASRAASYPTVASAGGRGAGIAVVTAPPTPVTVLPVALVPAPLAAAP